MLNQFKARKLKAMVEAAGYPGVAADMDDDVIASVLPYGSPGSGDAAEDHLGLRTSGQRDRTCCWSPSLERRAAAGQVHRRWTRQGRA